jgi:hypothetical protein
MLHLLQTAILHYVNGGLPALAAQSVIRHRWGGRLSPDVLDALLAKLASSSQHNAAGDLQEHLQRYDAALDSFRSYDTSLLILLHAGVIILLQEVNACSRSTASEHVSRITFA